MRVRCAIVLGLWLLIPFCPSAFAEDGLGVGVVVGANISSAHLTGTDATGINTGTKVGLLAGMVVNWPVSARVAIQPEVAYSQRHFAVNDTVGTFSATEQWDWLAVPVLVHVRLWEVDRTAVYVVGGPGFEFLLRAHEEAAGSSGDVKNLVKGADVSIVGGAGISTGKFALEVRYDGGLRDLNKDFGLGDSLVVKSRTVLVAVKWMVK